MRKIRWPHDPVDADFVTQFHADAIFEKSPVGVFFEIFAWLALELRQTEHPFGPKMVGFIFLIDLLAEIGQPADIIFGPVNLQLGKAIEDAGDDQLAYFHRARMMRRLARETLHEVSRRPLLAFRSFGIFE